MPTIFAVIPARGGSKGIPRKNIAPLGGKPLIAYTVEAGQNSRSIDRLVISTDDEEIGNVSRGLEVEVVKRPKKISGDGAMCDPVLQHAVEYLEALDGYSPDIVLLLPPTSPLRTGKHIDEAIEKFTKNGFDSLVSIFKINNNRHELRENEFLVPTFTKSKNRTKRPFTVFENGAIYISDITLIKQGRIRGDKIGYYEMDQYSSIDIDTLLDLEMAEKLLG